MATTLSAAPTERAGKYREAVLKHVFEDGPEPTEDELLEYGKLHDEDFAVEVGRLRERQAIPSIEAEIKKLEQHRDKLRWVIRCKKLADAIGELDEWEKYLRCSRDAMLKLEQEHKAERIRRQFVPNEAQAELKAGKTISVLQNRLASIVWRTSSREIERLIAGSQKTIADAEKKIEQLKEIAAPERRQKRLEDVEHELLAQENRPPTV